MYVQSIYIFNTGTSACPGKAMKHGDSCYDFVMEKMDFEAASAFCAESKGHLVSVLSEDEQTFLANTAKKLYDDEKEEDKKVTYWFIGEYILCKKLF